MHDGENTEEVVKRKEGTEEQKEAKVLEVEWTRGREGSNSQARHTRVYYQNTLHRLKQLLQADLHGEQAGDGQHGGKH